MASHKIERTTEDIKRELTAIFRELKDPRVRDAFISIIRVDLTNDLSYCTVYVSAIEGLDRCKLACKGLDSASGFIRHALAKEMIIRQSPELIFTEDRNIAYGAHIAQVLHEVGADQLPAEEEEPDA